MRTTFREKRFSRESIELIDQCDAIISEYSDGGFTLTLRQLYYQLVTKNVIPNIERSYKNLSKLVSDARLAGLLDWGGIEDRGRRPRTPYFWESAKDVVDTFKSTAERFRLDPWLGQRCYVELWVEKDALAGVLSPLAEKHAVTLMVNKGYSSQSAMYESARRFIQAGCDDDESRHGVILYLGDHDPSGEDMVRDIGERLHMFGARVEVIKVALTMEQVKRYRPPPNPAKVTDPRAAKYIEEHGDSSWEVDALTPSVLQRLISEKIEEHVDQRALKMLLEAQDTQRKWLTSRLRGFK